MVHPLRSSFAPPLLVSVLLLAPTAPLGRASAQVNIERLRLAPDSLGLTGSVGLTLTFASGNTEKRRGDGEARMDYTSVTRSLFGIVRGDFDWTGGERVSNRGLLHVRHIERRDRSLSPELFGQVNYDKARSLDFRGLVGAGVRVGVASGERGRASLGLAYMFEREELGIPPESEHPVETSHHRLSSFLTLALEPRPGLALASTSYVQPRLDAFDDVRVLSQSRLAVQLLGPLSMDVTLDLSYDARPPDDVESLDTSLRTGITVQF